MNGEEEFFDAVTGERRERQVQRLCREHEALGPRPQT